MSPRKDYVAKEAFTFPLICLVCLACFIYWGCTDGLPVGEIAGTSFFGIITLEYIFKYLRFGRDFLRIDADGITYKEWSKTTSLKWYVISKCTVCYRPSFAGVLFYRELDIALLSEAKRQKSISVRLSGKYCSNKNVINAIEQFGGTGVSDEQSSRCNYSIYLIVSRLRFKSTKPDFAGFTPPNLTVPALLKHPSLRIAKIAIFRELHNPMPARHRGKKILGLLTARGQYNYEITS